MVKLFLTGYEKENLDEFLDKLEKLEIKSLIDVREIPLSRRNEFSKKSLEKNLSERDITYHHFPSLGSPKKIRDSLHATGDYLTFFIKYRDHVNKELSSINNLTEIIMEDKRSVLLCYEKYYELCHRSIIVDKIIKKNPKIMAIPI